jgi:predicted HicB family RNase H-like nuclease
MDDYQDYSFIMNRGLDGKWHGRFLDLPESSFSAADQDELLRNAKSVFDAWILNAQETGISIPEPGSSKNVSGALKIHVPRILHQRLLEISDTHGTSLNGLVTPMLSVGLSWLEGEGNCGKRGFCENAADVAPITIRKKKLKVNNNMVSGVWIQRVPIELHQKIMVCAKTENVSVNSICNMLLVRVLTTLKIETRSEAHQ